MTTAYVITAVCFIFILTIAALYFSRRNGLRVLMYHKVSDNDTDFLTVTASQLEDHIRYLQRRNYTFISLSALLSHMEKGTALPKRSVLLTFDDGYQNNFTYAYPVLQDCQVPAAIFVVPSFAGQTLNYDGMMQRFLSVKELQQMNLRVEYGMHSFKHDSYRNLTTEEIDKDIQLCEDFANETGVPLLPCIAYPYGAYSRDAADIRNMFEVFRRRRILAAFRIGNRINMNPPAHNYLVQRLDIRGDESFFRFRLKVTFGKII